MKALRRLIRGVFRRRPHVHRTADWLDPDNTRCYCGAHLTETGRPDR